MYQIASLSGGFEAQAFLDEKTADEVSAGIAAQVSRGSDGFAEPVWMDGTVTAKSEPDENKQVAVMIALPPEIEWKTGETLAMRVVQKKERYENCIPLAALRADSEGYFVFTLEEEKTILGTETVLVRSAVTVSAQNTEQAAVEGGAQETIVLTANKPVTAGDRVRVVAK